MLGIIIAMKEESPNLAKSAFAETFTHIIRGLKFYMVKTLSGELAIITYAGIGKVNAAIAATTMIQNFNINACFNIGSVGVSNDTINVKCATIIDKTYYGDVDVTMFDYAINQVPHMPVEYSMDKDLNQVLLNIVKATECQYSWADCQTSDSFINQNNCKNYHLTEKNTPIVLDMECAAIAQVCHVFKIPFCSIKVAIDKLHHPEQNQVQFKKNMKEVSGLIELLAVNAIEALVFKLASK